MCDFPPKIRAMWHASPWAAILDAVRSAKQIVYGLNESVGPNLGDTENCGF
jgi:hypothetical protein